MPTPSNGMTAAEIIRLTMPEFSDIAEETIEKWISLMRPLVSRVKFKHQYEYAVALLVGHKLKLSGAGLGEQDATKTVAALASNGVASVSEGESSISFDTSANSILAAGSADAEYATTVYGQQFVSLRRQLVMSIAIDGSGVRSWQA